MKERYSFPLGFLMTFGPQSGCLIGRLRSQTHLRTFTSSIWRSIARKCFCPESRKLGTLGFHPSLRTLPPTAVQAFRLRLLVSLIFLISRFVSGLSLIVIL